MGGDPAKAAIPEERMHSAHGTTRESALMMRHGTRLPGPPASLAWSCPFAAHEEPAPIREQGVVMHRRSLLPSLCLLLAAFGLMYSGSGLAQHSPALDRVSVWLGGYYDQSGTTLSAGTADATVRGDVNLEDDLGFARRAWSPRVRADFLVGDSQGISIDYYRYRRDRSASLADSIAYDGVTYDAHASVRGKLGFDFGSIAYRWWIGKGKDVFGVGLGAGYYKVDASIAGEASVNGESAQAESSTRASAWAPLLQLGWRHAFNDQWRMYLNASGVKKNGGHLYGHICNIALGVQWFPTGHFGISAEYGIDRIRLHQRHGTYNDSLDLRLDGPSVFATFRY
jgi:hypothetical protein